MADHSTIEWTDATWNPVTGCAVVSPGCTKCYAMKLAGTRLKNLPSRAGLTRDTKAGPVWTGAVRLNEEWLTQPLRWRRPRRIFVCAHGDLFAENVPDEWIDRVFAVMALAPQHTFQVLTKRAGRMRKYVAGVSRNPIPRLSDDIAAQMGSLAATMPHFAKLTSDFIATQLSHRIDPDNGGWPLPNVWLGVSTEDQARADERIPDLLATPAAIRFVSAEPLLGPIDFERINLAGIINPFDALRGDTWGVEPRTKKRIYAGGRNERLDWIIVGGESGRAARPMHPAWAHSIRDQCAVAGVRFFFKQWGNFRPLTPAERGQACGATHIRGCDRYDRDAYVMPTTKKRAGRLLDGVEHNGFPEARP